MDMSQPDKSGEILEILDSIFGYATGNFQTINRTHELNIVLNEEFMTGLALQVICFSFSNEWECEAIEMMGDYNGQSIGKLTLTDDLIDFDLENNELALFNEKINSISEFKRAVMKNKLNS